MDPARPLVTSRTPQGHQICTFRYLPPAPNPPCTRAFVCAFIVCARVSYSAPAVHLPMLSTYIPYARESPLSPFGAQIAHSASLLASCVTVCCVWQPTALHMAPDKGRIMAATVVRDIDCMTASTTRAMDTTSAMPISRLHGPGVV